MAPPATTYHQAHLPPIPFMYTVVLLNQHLATKRQSNWGASFCCIHISPSTRSHKTGCYPWRLGVPSYSTHLETRRHPFVTPGKYIYIYPHTPHHLKFLVSRRPPGRVTSSTASSPASVPPELVLGALGGAAAQGDPHRNGHHHIDGSRASDEAGEGGGGGGGGLQGEGAGFA